MRNLLFAACIVLFAFENAVSAQNITVDGANFFL
jgi:hypothetical protein